MGRWANVQHSTAQSHSSSWHQARNVDAWTRWEERRCDLRGGGSNKILPTSTAHRLRHMAGTTRARSPQESLLPTQKATPPGHETRTRGAGWALVSLAREGPAQAQLAHSHLPACNLHSALCTLRRPAHWPQGLLLLACCYHWTVPARYLLPLHSAAPAAAAAAPAAALCGAAAALARAHRSVKSSQAWSLSFSLSHPVVPPPLLRPLVHPSTHPLLPLSQPFPFLLLRQSHSAARPRTFLPPSSSHDTLEFMNCFHSLPCPAHSNLFVPRGASHLASSPSPRPSRPSLRPRTSNPS